MKRYNVQWKCTMCNENVQCAMKMYNVQWKCAMCNENVQCAMKMYNVHWKYTITISMTIQHFNTITGFACISIRPLGNTIDAWTSCTAQGMYRSACKSRYGVKVLNCQWNCNCTFSLHIVHFHCTLYLFIAHCTFSLHIVPFPCSFCIVALPPAARWPRSRYFLTVALLR